MTRKIALLAALAAAPFATFADDHAAASEDTLTTPPAMEISATAAATEEATDSMKKADDHSGHGSMKKDAAKDHSEHSESAE